jgi:hypothetical protein
MSLVRAGRGSGISIVMGRIRRRWQQEALVEYQFVSNEYPPPG